MISPHLDLNLAGDLYGSRTSGKSGETQSDHQREGYEGQNR